MMNNPEILKDIRFLISGQATPVEVPSLNIASAQDISNSDQSNLNEAVFHQMDSTIDESTQEEIKWHSTSFEISAIPNINQNIDISSLSLSSISFREIFKNDILDEQNSIFFNLKEINKSYDQNSNTNDNLWGYIFSNVDKNEIQKKDDVNTKIKYGLYQLIHSHLQSQSNDSLNFSKEDSEKVDKDYSLPKPKEDSVSRSLHESDLDSKSLNEIKEEIQVKVQFNRKFKEISISNENITDITDRYLSFPKCFQNFLYTYDLDYRSQENLYPQKLKQQIVVKITDPKFYLFDYSSNHEDIKICLTRGFRHEMFLLNLYDLEIITKTLG